MFESIRITLDEWRGLSEHSGQRCVSIYMPIVRAGRETRQNATRFKNCLAEVDRGLAARGVERSEINAALASLSELLEDDGIAGHHAEGLAVFMEGTAIQRWAVTPLRLPQLIVVSRRFQLTPLLPLVLGDGLFYVVVISQSEVRLTECTRDGFIEIPLEQLPHGREIIDRYIEEDKGLQAQSVPGAAPSRGRQAVMYHGQGAPDLNDKARIFEYFRKVDEALREVIGSDRGAPVVFAGVEYLFPIYQQANRSLDLLPEIVRGNFDEVRADLAGIHAAAWKLVEHRFVANLETELSLVREAIAKRQGSSDIGEIIQAGAAGLIEHLAVNPAIQQWGVFNEETGRIAPASCDGGLDEDLINLACILAVRCNAVVTALRDNDVHLGGRALAAAFRAPVEAVQ